MDRQKMSLKIADIISEVLVDVTGCPNITAGNKSLVGQLTPKLVALIEQREQAMKEALATARDYVEDASNGKMGEHLIAMATEDLGEINKILGG